MMKNKMLKKAVILPLFFVTLVACGGNSFSKSTKENYSNRALDEAMGMTALNSVGEQKLLVVPIVFTNTTTYATEALHESIEKLFFGASDETGWESVSSYYEKSSYGKLKLVGEVQPYFHLPWSTHELAQKPVDEKQESGPGHYWDETHHVIENLYNTSDANLLKEYDQDGDGHVDGLWMVYIADINAVGEDSSVFWAYKFYWNRAANRSKPTPNTYAWASYRFANEGRGYSFEKPDAHTFIHETGHMLGLPDYYDYDKSPQTGMAKTNPTGGIDMMAFNIIDHNAYSKYRYNWISPYYADKSGSITLKPFESSGDAVLLKGDWNGHAYDEYLLIEYYTPTGLNEKDSQENGYIQGTNTSGTQGFTIPGVRIWHVDSRLLQLTTNSAGEITSQKWTDEIKGTSTSVTVVGPSNTASRSTDEEHNLLHLLDREAPNKSGRTGSWLKSSTTAGDDALFQTGDEIKADGWKTYFSYSDTFNDGTAVGYSVKIGKMNSKGVTITIKKV